MEEREWLDSLKPGDDVFVQSHGAIIEAPYYSGVVKKITPKRHIVVTLANGNECRFSETGREKTSDSWHFSSLVEPNAERQEEIMVYRAKAKIHNAIKKGALNDLSSKQLNEILSMMTFVNPVKHK